LLRVLLRALGSHVCAFPPLVVPPFLRPGIRTDSTSCLTSPPSPYPVALVFRVAPAPCKFPTDVSKAHPSDELNPRSFPLLLERLLSLPFSFSLGEQGEFQHLVSVAALPDSLTSFRLHCPPRTPARPVQFSVPACSLVDLYRTLAFSPPRDVGTRFFARTANLKYLFTCPGSFFAVAAVSPPFSRRLFRASVRWVHPLPLRLCSRFLTLSCRE